jgi:YjjG family noncanonical pyrimidine nucleotidase
MRYPTVLLDLDHTLIDSAAAEVSAFEITLTSAGIDDPRQHLDAYLDINHALWKQVERGELQPGDVRHTRFNHFVSAVGLDADYMELSNAYGVTLAAESRLFPGAREVLEQLAEVSALAMITNGLSDVQRSRIAHLELEPYFDAIVISAEVGHTKPGTAIFDEVFDQLGSPERSSALMVGDSLSSDIQGGTNYGIDTCWYNPEGAAPDGVMPTHVIARLGQLPELVSTGRLG